MYTINTFRSMLDVISNLKTIRSNFKWGENGD